MRVALAVDVADADADGVVRAGVAWAMDTGGVVDLVYAEGGRYTHTFVGDPELRALFDRESARARAGDQERLRQLQQLIPEAQRGDTRMITGRVVDVLVEAARSYDALLVVTHGQHALPRFFLGSVAEQLVRRCRVPVVVLRAT